MREGQREEIRGKPGHHFLRRRKLSALAAVVRQRKTSARFGQWLGHGGPSLYVSQLLALVALSRRENDTVFSEDIDAQRFLSDGARL